MRLSEVQPNMRHSVRGPFLQLAVGSDHRADALAVVREAVEAHDIHGLVQVEYEAEPAGPQRLGGHDRGRKGLRQVVALDTSARRPSFRRTIADGGVERVPVAEPVLRRASPTRPSG